MDTGRRASQISYTNFGSLAGLDGGIGQIGGGAAAGGINTLDDQILAAVVDEGEGAGVFGARSDGAEIVLGGIKDDCRHIRPARGKYGFALRPTAAGKQH